MQTKISVKFDIKKRYDMEKIAEASNCDLLDKREQLKPFTYIYIYILLYFLKSLFISH